MAFYILSKPKTRYDLYTDFRTILYKKRSSKGRETRNESNLFTERILAEHVEHSPKSMWINGNTIRYRHCVPCERFQVVTRSIGINFLQRSLSHEHVVGAEMINLS